jgi:hypothetical protein
VTVTVNDLLAISPTFGSAGSIFALASFADSYVLDQK